MSIVKKKLALVFIQCNLVVFCSTQITNNSEKLVKWNEKYEAGILKISPVIVPTYNPDIKLSTSIGLLSTFKTKRNNPYLKHSYLPIVINTDFKANHIISGDLYSFFYDDLLMVNIKSDFHNREDHYFGIGYSESSSISKGDNTTRYHLKMIQFSPNILVKITNNLYGGLSLNYNSTNATEFSILMQEDPLLLKQNAKIKNTGIGFTINYSTSNLKSKSSIVELNTSFILFGSLFAGPFNYEKWNFNYKHRFMLFNKDRLLITLNSENNFGDVPWTDMAFLGGERNMLGLPSGKYRDKSSLHGNIEYRYTFSNINNNQISRHHLLLQFGGGTVYGEPLSESPVILNMSLGYLFKYQPDYFMSIFAGFAENTFGVYLKFDKVL